MPRAVKRTPYKHPDYHHLRAVVVVVCIVLIGLWWWASHPSTTKTFWDSMDNNLATASVTKHDVQSQQGDTTNQYTQMEFGVMNASHALSTVTQQGNTVTSETIGSPRNDYSRYVSIKTTQKSLGGQNIKSDKFLGIWGKSPDAPANVPASVQYFQQSVLGIVPFGNFTAQQRHDLIKLMQDNKTYSLGPVENSKLNGRGVYIYAVNINPQSLIELLQQYAKDLGLGNIGLDPSQYAGSPPIRTQFTIDKLSRNLVKVHYSADSQDETYSSQGLEQPITLPVKAIPIDQLQNKVVQSLK